MLKRIIWLTNLVLISAALSSLYSQYSEQDNQRKILNQQVEELISLSNNIFGKDTRLVIGRIYSPPHIKAKGNPYIKGLDWLPGNVNINGNNFSGLKLNYDIFQDNLIYLDESPDGSMKVLLLNKNQVEKFEIEDHSFLTLRPSMVKNITESQYFEVLYQGEISLFNMWTKAFEAVTTQEFPSGRFMDLKVTRYLLKNNELHKVNNRYALLKLCEDRKEEIKKYLRKNRIIVRKGRDEQLAGLIEYYNSLITG